MSKKKVSTRLHLDPSQLATQLRALADSFERRKVVITHDDSFVSLTPTDSMDLELEAETKKGKSKLSLELSWQQQLPPEAAVPLTISSEEPELEEQDDDATEPS